MIGMIFRLIRNMPRRIVVHQGEKTNEKPLKGYKDRKK